MELERARELLKMASLADQLPLTFENGSRVAHLGTDCLACGQALSSAEIHGEMRCLLRHVIQVEAVGYCRACNLLTPLACRIDDQLTIIMQKNGHWARFEPRPDSLWTRMYRRLGRGR